MIFASYGALIVGIVLVICGATGQKYEMLGFGIILALIGGFTI